MGDVAGRGSGVWGSGVGVGGVGGVAYGGVAWGTSPVGGVASHSSYAERGSGVGDVAGRGLSNTATSTSTVSVVTGFPEEFFSSQQKSMFRFRPIHHHNDTA